MAESENPAAPLPAHTFSLYAGDLHPDVTEHDLYNLFSRISQSHTVHLCRNQITHHSLCYAYINFFFPFHAATALCRLNHTVLKGKPIRIMWVQTDAFLRRTGIGNLFVKNLAVDIDVGKLKDVFGVFGRIISCKIAKNDDGKSKGFGYVQFDSEESAAEALSALDGSVLDGKILTVAKYLNKSERKKPQFTNVYVKNLDVDFTESSLLEKFSEYGKVTSAVIVNDAEGKSRGFGFVNFESHENAKKAIKALNDAEIGSKKWFVGKAMKKSERDAILKRAHRKQKPDLLNLLVRNLATSVKENDLREVFGAFGCVTSAKVICDENGISKGFAYVCFSNSEDAKKATRSLNGLYYYGKYIHVSIALSKEEYDRHLQTLVSLQYMFPFRDMVVPKPAEKEDLVPNYQELLEKQVEKENRVPKLKKPLKRQVELEDRVPSLLKPLGNHVETEDRVPSLWKPLENQADKENQDPNKQVLLEKQVEKENRVPILQKSLEKRAKKDRRVKEASFNDGALGDFVLVDNSASNSEWGI